MKSFRIIHACQVILLLAVAMVFSAAAAFSQNALPNAPQQASPPEALPSPTPDKTRARRVAPGSTAGETTTGSVTTATELPLSNATSETKGAPDSEMMALRDKIDAAQNAQERARLRLKLVEQLLSAGRKQEAVAELHSMGAEDRFDPQGFYNIANALARVGETDLAITTYRKAIDQRKGRYSRAFNNLGVILVRQGFWDEAYEAFMSALRLESFRYAEASYNLGRLHAARGEGDLAVREWRRAIAVDPEHKAAAQALANAGSAESITVAALRPANRSVSDRASNRGSRGREDERRSGPPAGLISSSPRKSPGVLPALTVDPETYTFLQRARTSRDRSRHGEAVESYRRVISRMGGYFAPANLELGYSLITLKRNEEAIAILLPVSVKDGARYPISNYHLARLYELRNDLRLAEESYARASESYRDGNAQFLLDLSRVREKLGNFSGAVMSMEQYVTILERQGQKPEWSDERLTALRQKLAASGRP